ncbi:MAG: histidine kinase [Desulfovibrionaceae bacterium]
MNHDIRIALAIRDEDGRSKLEKVISGAPGVSLQQEGEPSDILIYEVEAGRETDLLALGQDLRRQTGGEIFLASAETSPELLIQAMRAGIHEFLPLPVPPRELGKALSRFVARQRNGEQESAPGQGHITIVAGVKSGCGATTLAVNLAHELQASAGRTALLDLRLPMGEAPLFLDLEYAYTWGDVAANIDRLDGTYLDSVMARHDSGLQVLASPGGSLLDAQDLAEAVTPLLAEMRRHFNHVVVDTDAGLTAYGYRELDAADTALLVMNPSLPCLAHAKRVVDAVRQAGGNESKIRLVVNRHLPDGDIGTHDAEEILQKKIFATLPEDYKGTLAAINQGKPLSQAAPKSAMGKAVAKLARSMSRNGSRNATKSKGGLLGLFRKNRNSLAAGMEAV